MNEVLDGTASEEQSHRVQMALAGDTGARQRFEEIKQLHDLLNRTHRFPAPTDIRPAILRTIEARPGGRPRTRPFGSGPWISISRRPAVGMAWSFATGALAVLVGLALVRGSTTAPERPTNQPGPSHFAGTMVRNDGEISFRPLSEERLDIPGGAVVARVLGSERVLRVEISVSTVTESSLSLTYPASERALTRIIPEGSTPGRIDMAVGRVDWYPPQAGRITLEFNVGGLEEPFGLETLVEGATRRVTLATWNAAKGR
ncbi:MAG: hypothetical protein SGI90_05150 [Candidatus Eisenbacteria bacterium]|nr:hypothetical protein [Candidatus Eisenbacteria bacterium]